MRRLLLLVSILLLAFACAAPPEASAPGTSEAWGMVRLVPREGVAPGKPGAAAYGDRRLRDVEFVDYTRPGFAVVYVEQATAPGGEVALAIRGSRVGIRLEPAHVAVGASGRVSLRNDSAESHVVSYPAAGIIRPLAAGESTTFEVPRAGEQGLFVLDEPDAGATLFAAPGSFGVASAAGRYRVTGLAPGAQELRVWHPRFPPAVRAVVLAPGASVEVDFEIGVGRSGGAHAHH
jgi:hypothetical protein